MPYIKSLDAFGRVEVLFTKPLQKISDRINLATLEYNPEPDVWRPVLTLTVEPSLAQDTSKVGMTWSIIERTQTSMKFQLAFENPLHISFE